MPSRTSAAAVADSEGSRTPEQLEFGWLVIGVLDQRRPPVRLTPGVGCVDARRPGIGGRLEVGLGLAQMLGQPGHAFLVCGADSHETSMTARPLLRGNPSAAGGGTTHA